MKRSRRPGRGQAARAAAAPHARSGGRDGAGPARLHVSIYGWMSMLLLLQSTVTNLDREGSAQFIFGASVPSWHLKVVRLIAFSLLCTGFIAMALDKLYGWGMQHTLAATMMKLALCVWGLSASLFLGALEMIFHMLTPWGILVYLGIANVVCWVPYWHLVAEDEDFARTKDHLWRLASAAVSLLRLRTLPGALYLLLAIVFAATGLACVLAGAHEAMMVHVFCNVYGKGRTMALEHVISGFFSFLAAISWRLKGQAEKHLLAQPVSRIVNVSLFAASTGHLLILVPQLMQGLGGWMLASFTATWGLALLAGTVGLAAPDAAALAEAARRE